MSALKNLKRQQSLKSSGTSATGKRESMLSRMIPKFLKDSLGSVSRKQWMDITLFTGGLYCMYRYGGNLSSFLEKMMPNEEQMLKLMQEQMAQA